MFIVVIGLCSCNNSTSTEKKEDNSNTQIENKVVSSEFDYSGIYSIIDKTVCELTITIQKKGNGFLYKINNSEGKVEIIKQDSETYLNFIALNGDSPKGDVEAKYENETLIIQNEGNSMNQYTNFKNCDAKYLELKKIK